MICQIGTFSVSAVIVYMDEPIVVQEASNFCLDEIPKLVFSILTHL